jgi:hypothetical protein
MLRNARQWKRTFNNQGMWMGLGQKSGERMAGKQNEQKESAIQRRRVAKSN